MATRTGTASNSLGPTSLRQPPQPTVTTTPEVDAGTKSINPGRQHKDVTVQLQYLRDDPLYDTVKPIQITPNFLDHAGKTNVRLEAGRPEVINDVRGREHEFTLDTNGFCYVKAPTSFKNWSAQPQIAKEYLPEMEELLRREIDGCDEIIFYDARIRQAGDEGARVHGLSYNPFARQVHVDNTETSVLEKIRSTTELKAEYYQQGRIRIINIWRPIKHPVYDCGLAIADGNKLRTGDVIECDRHRSDTGSYWDTMGVVKYRPGYDWYYMSLQDEPDVLLFKNYDSATDVPSRNCLHTAFDIPPSEVPADAPTRESIEVRAFVFTYPEGTPRPSGDATPHPLAIQLEQETLHHFVDDEHSITDRLRTDIDEGKEIKDAVLLLRKRETRKLEKRCEQQGRALQETQEQLQLAHQQIDIQTAHTEVLQRKVADLEHRLSQTPDALHDRISHLTRELGDAHLRERTRARTENDGLPPATNISDAGSTSQAQIAHMMEHIERQSFEIEKWKEEAMGKSKEAVSLCWQSSVDEAVRREREKDQHVITSLVREIDELKSAGQQR